MISSPVPIFLVDSPVQKEWPKEGVTIYHKDLERTTFYTASVARRWAYSLQHTPVGGIHPRGAALYREYWNSGSLDPLIQAGVSLPNPLAPIGRRRPLASIYTARFDR